MDKLLIVGGIFAIFAINAKNDKTRYKILGAATLLTFIMFQWDGFHVAGHSGQAVGSCRTKEQYSSIRNNRCEYLNDSDDTFNTLDETQRRSRCLNFDKGGDGDDTVYYCEYIAGTDAEPAPEPAPEPEPEPEPEPRTRGSCPGPDILGNRLCGTGVPQQRGDRTGTCFPYLATSHALNDGSRHKVADCDEWGVDEDCDEKYTTISTTNGDVDVMCYQREDGWGGGTCAPADGDPGWFGNQIPGKVTDAYALGAGRSRGTFRTGNRTGSGTEGQVQRARVIEETSHLCECQPESKSTGGTGNPQYRSTPGKNCEYA